MDIRQVLCPVDFSDTSYKALHHAAAIARWYGAELHVLNAIMPMNPPLAVGASLPQTIGVESQEAAERSLRRMVDRVGIVRGESREVVCIGTAAGAILDYAREQRIDLIVLGTHGLSGIERMLLGSVAERVLHHAPCPVLTIPRMAPDVDLRRSLRFQRIVCAIDFSPACSRTVDVALSMAKENDAELTFLHVLEKLVPEGVVGAAHYRVSEYVGQRKRDACHQLSALIPAEARDWCHPSVQVEIGPAAQTILRIADERDADLIVMGAQGHGVLGTLFMGSATQTVVRRATCPVLTVRTRV